jgi:hypothetical protein
MLRLGARICLPLCVKGLRNSLKMDRQFLQEYVSTTALLMPKQNNKSPTFFNETRKNMAGRFTVTHTTNKTPSQSRQYSTIWQINGWRNLNKVKFINLSLSSHSKLLLRIFYKRKQTQVLISSFLLEVRYTLSGLNLLAPQLSSLNRSLSVSTGYTHTRVPGSFIMGVGLSIFSLVDLRFFCPSKCIHTLTSECE